LTIIFDKEGTRKPNIVGTLLAKLMFLITL